jgi:Uma2 family endonuclease
VNPLGETMMATAATPRLVGPQDHGQRMTLEEFIDAEFEEGFLYELSGGVVEVTEVPGPNHGRIVLRLARLFFRYNEQHPGVIDYQAGCGECRLRLPGMSSDRHPDQAIYLDPQPPGPAPWTRWIPHLAVEVVSEGGEDRDYVVKRQEYLAAGIREYWIIDPSLRQLRILIREGDAWAETILTEGQPYHTPYLPGLEVVLEELLGIPGA